MTQLEAINAKLAATHIKVFAELVKEMRLAQSAYFRTRSKEGLIDAKSLEAQVDEAVRIVGGVA